jgi:hypothetical protein
MFERQHKICLLRSEISGLRPQVGARQGKLKQDEENWEKLGQIEARRAS